MTPNLHPYYQVSIKIKDVEEINTIIIDSCKELNWQIQLNENNLIEANTSSSTTTNWGENIKIINNNSHIDFVSSSTGNQILDWGKNKKNLKNLTDKLYNKIGNQIIDFKTSKSNNLSSNKNLLKTLISILKPTKNYFVTPLLLLINIVVFIGMLVDGTSFLFPNPEKIIEWGANFRTLTLNEEPWRLVTCLFVHIGFIHLIINILILLLVGSTLEPLIGKTKFAIAFLVTGILSSATSSFWNTFSINAGASGAIFGLFGVLIAILTTNNVTKSIKKPTLILISIYTGLSIIISINVGIDVVASCVGFLAGTIIGYIYYYGIITNEVKTNYWINGSIIFLGFAFSFLIVEQIPNPIKRYKSDAKNKIDYFKLYQIKMKDFETNETLAMEVFTHGSENKKDFLEFINDRTMWYWEENLKITKEIENYSLPKQILENNKIAKNYTQLRIKQTKLMYKMIETNDKKYNKDFLEIDQEIKNALYEIAKFK